MLSADVNKCREVGWVLKSLSIRKSFYQREFISFNASRETKLRSFLMAAAICHQTHALHHPGKNLWGWDFMEYAFLNISREKRAFLNPDYISICADQDIETLLREVFSHDRNPEHCTLDRIQERGRMLTEICNGLKTNYQSSVSNLVDAAEGRLLNEGRGLYESLSRFEAFSDSFRKKITFFIKLASDAGVLYIRDSNNLIPIMDYHMQRVLLRMGCVNFRNSTLRIDLVEKKPLESDQEVRSACVEAIRIIADESGHGILKMNDYFWPLGRSCCNATTLCIDRKCLKTPCTFFELVALNDHTVCPFENVCIGAKDESFRTLWEPMVDTHFY